MRFYTIKLLFTTLSVVTLSINSFGQGCPNANFSMNNFTNWLGFTGSFAAPSTTPGIVAGRHTIISTAGTDPNTGGGLPMLPPGSTYSCRLGNNSTGAEAEVIKYTLNVNPNNALLIYKFAAVLENPTGHGPTEQPKFEVRLLLANGTIITNPCSQYDVYGGQPGQGFQTTGTVTWMPWKTVALNLQPYIGQTIQVEYTTKDCSLSGHFGYAYVSAQCYPLTLNVNYCLGANNVVVSAPTGFQNYLWQNNSTNQSYNITNPVYGQTVSCTMTTFSNLNNCQVTISTQVYPTEFESGFTADTVCVNTPTHFTDTSSVNVGNTITGRVWNFGDGSTGSVQANPNHTYTTSGTFLVRLILTSNDNCKDTVFQSVYVKPQPALDFTATDACLGDTSYFVNQSQDTLSPTYTWFLSNGQPMVADTNAQYLYPNLGSYNIILFATNSLGCSASLTKVHTVHDKPVVSAGPDIDICAGVPMLLHGQGALTYTWDNNVTDSVLFTPLATGDYHMVGTDIYGCFDLDTVHISLYTVPIVDAGIDQEVCDGTDVLFSASGADTYSWSNGVVDSVQFTPTVGITTYYVTGFGANNCQSTDSLVLIVNASPIVQAGNDTIICIGESMTLSGTGASNYVWDNNVTNGVAFIPTATLTYTVVGTTAEGCTGTDQRTVTIEPRINPSFSSDVIEGCVPLDVLFANTSTGTPYVQSTWNLGDGNSSSLATNVANTYQAAGCYDVSLTLKSALGCQWDTTIIDYICVYPNPVASFTPNPGILSEIDPVTTMSNTSLGAVTYEWDFQDGSAVSTEFNPEHTFPTSPVQNYVVQLMAISDKGCKDSITKNVLMTEGNLYFVPNAFTPDEDEFNPTFQPIFTSGFDPYDFNMKIYNRWGEIIFESNSHTTGWDGTYHGKLVREGIYNWTIEFKKAKTDERKIIYGHVTIMK
jgi:gliding motility-associated-like protein